MHLIVYTSTYTGNTHEVPSVLFNITEIAKTYNEKYSITGLLFLHGDCFVQIIEGARQSLEGLMSILDSDKRHKDIIRLVDEPIQARSYSDWNMDSFNLSDSQSLNSDKLLHISRIYKETLSTRTDLLTKFYKAMLVSPELGKL